MFSEKRGSFLFRKAAACLTVIFFINSVIPAPAMAQAVQTILPFSSSISAPSSAFIPVHIKALKVRADEPLVFDFVIDNGTTGLKGAELKNETQKLAKYFLAAVTIPEKDLWVNLSPYENDRIIPNELGLTEMGRQMLSQDSVLKQVSASIINPETATGKLFWDKLYAKAREVLGTVEIPLDSLQKIWIVPAQAKVYEFDNTALLGGSKLKVMLDQDYYALGLQAKSADTDVADADAARTRDLSLQAMRDVVIPAVEKEVNEGKDFAPLRQVYGAMIFATWYKKALKETLLAQVYADKKKTAGVETEDLDARERIYQEYVEAFKKGAFSFIREDADPVSGEVIPRKYFSGGIDGTENARTVAEGLEHVQGLKDVPSASQAPSAPDSSETVATVALQQKDGVSGVKDFEVATGVSYFKGDIKTTPITRPFRASRQDDVSDITKLNEQQELTAERAGAESVERGEGAFFVLAAGAASRMAVVLAPDDVKQLAGGEEILSKAGVPVGVIDGKTVNYLDVFGHNVARLLEGIDREARSQGVTSAADRNIVGVFTNDEYRAEHDRILAKSGNYGLKAGQLRLFHQPLGPKYVGTPEDVKKLEAKFASPEAFARALALAQDVQAKIASGDREAAKSVVLASERDPQGHGEFFHQLIVSGEFLYLFNHGKKWIAVKNIDNIAAKFDRVWLRILGLFLNGKLDAQPEVSLRAPGQKGGSLIVMEDNGSHQLAEDPSLNATKDEQGKVKVTPTQSFWFNDAVALFSLNYIVSIYKKDGQTDEDFIAELRGADQLKREEIADRGRQKFPKLLDPKPAKKQDAVAVKIETNMWQSTGIVPQSISVKAVGVRGARNFPIAEYPAMAQEQRTAELAKLRFLGTKQWSLSDAEVMKARADLEAAVGRPVTDAELSLTLETYSGNKILTDDLLDYIWNQPLVRPGVFNGVDGKDLVAEGSSAAQVVDFNDANIRAQITESVDRGNARIGFVKPGAMEKAGADWIMQVITDEIAKRDLPLSVVVGPRFQMTRAEAEQFYIGHKGRRNPAGFEYAPGLWDSVSNKEAGWFLLQAGPQGMPSEQEMKDLKNAVRDRYSKEKLGLSGDAVLKQRAETDNGPHWSDPLGSDTNAANEDWNNLQAMLDTRPALQVGQPNDTTGGINFNAALLDMTVERSGSGVKVNIDPVLIQRIKTRGVEGFAPVIINMMPVTGMGQALGVK